MSTESEPRALRRIAAAKYIGASPTELDTLRRNGKLAARYKGRIPLYLREELDRYLDTLPSEPKSA